MDVRDGAGQGSGPEKGGQGKVLIFEGLNDAAGETPLIAHEGHPAPVVFGHDQLILAIAVNVRDQQPGRQVFPPPVAGLPVVLGGQVSHGAAVFFTAFPGPVSALIEKNMLAGKPYGGGHRPGGPQAALDEVEEIDIFRQADRAFAGQARTFERKPMDSAGVNPGAVGGGFLTGQETAVARADHPQVPRQPLSQRGEGRAVKFQNETDRRAFFILGGTDDLHAVIPVQVQDVDGSDALARRKGIRGQGGQGGAVKAGGPDVFLAGVNDLVLAVPVDIGHSQPHQVFIDVIASPETAFLHVGLFRDHEVGVQGRGDRGGVPAQHVVGRMPGGRGRPPFGPGGNRNGQTQPKSQRK